MGCMKSKETFPFPTTINRGEPPRWGEPPERGEPAKRCGLQVPSPVTKQMELEEVEEVEELQVQELQVQEPVGPKVSGPKVSGPRVAGPKVAVSQFAHRLSQDIVSGALQQWVDTNARFADIPFIESEGFGEARR